MTSILIILYTQAFDMSKMSYPKEAPPSVSDIVVSIMLLVL